MKRCLLVALVAAAALAGCKTAYTWTSAVPSEMRTVCVPTFRNESSVTELGSVASRQILREFQREGTFRIAHPDDAAVEVQGVVRRASSRFSGGNRKTGVRIGEFLFTMEAVVSVVDRRNGRVLVDNRKYSVETTYASGSDIQTGQRDASGRLAEELARQVVDDVLALQW